MKPKLDHIGIATLDLDKAIETFCGALGLPEHGREVVEDQGVEVAFVEAGDGSMLEFLRPTREDSPIAGFLQKKGEGIHHLAFRVDDLEAALASLKEKGFALIDEKPRIGAHGKKIAFLHPRGTMKVLVELCQEAD